MESVKEFYRGLMGFHLIDPETNTFHSPSVMRKLWGWVLVFYFMGPMLYMALLGIFGLFAALFAGQWLIAIAVIFGIPLMIGFQSIFGWVIIDWDERRVRKNLAKDTQAV